MHTCLSRHTGEGWSLGLRRVVHLPAFAMHPHVQRAGRCGGSVVAPPPSCTPLVLGWVWHTGGMHLTCCMHAEIEATTHLPARRTTYPWRDRATAAMRSSLLGMQGSSPTDRCGRPGGGEGGCTFRLAEKREACAGVCVASHAADKCVHACGRTLHAACRRAPSRCTSAVERRRSSSS